MKDISVDYESKVNSVRPVGLLIDFSRQKYAEVREKKMVMITQSYVHFHPIDRSDSPQEKSSELPAKRHRFGESWFEWSKHI